MRKTKQNMCKIKGLPTEIFVYLFTSLMFTSLPNHFSLLTMELHSSSILSLLNTSVTRFQQSKNLIFHRTLLVRSSASFINLSSTIVILTALWSIAILLIVILYFGYCHNLTKIHIDPCPCCVWFTFLLVRSLSLQCLDLRIKLKLLLSVRRCAGILPVVFDFFSLL